MPQSCRIERIFWPSVSWPVTPISVTFASRAARFLAMFAAPPTVEVIFVCARTGTGASGDRWGALPWRAWFRIRPPRIRIDGFLWVGIVVVGWRLVSLEERSFGRREDELVSWI